MGFGKLSLSDIKFNSSGYGSLGKTNTGKSAKMEKAANYEPLLKFEDSSKKVSTSASKKVSKKAKAKKSESAPEVSEQVTASKKNTKKGKVSKGQGKITQADEELYDSMDPLIRGKYRENGYTKEQMIKAYRHYLEVDEPAMRKADERKYNVRSSNGMTYEEAMSIIDHYENELHGQLAYMETKQYDNFNILRLNKNKIAKENPDYAAAKKAKKEIEEKHPDVKSMWVQKHGRMPA